MEKPEILQRLFTRTATRFLVRTHRIIQRMPVERRSIQCSRVLVLAPHSDDEVISAGGVLALHQRAGSAVRVLCVSSDSKASPETLEARRMVEARTVAEFLGHELVFLEFPDGSLSLCERQLALEVRKHIDQFAPSIILVPFPGDHHRDHQAVAAACARALDDTEFGGEFWCYEVWSTLWPNCVVDIDAVVQVKRQAISLYAAATGEMPYADAVIGLNRYRGLKLQIPHAEAFFVSRKNQFVRLVTALNSI